MSEVQIKAQRDISIAGDVVGRDKIAINITRGLDELPTRYDSRVQNFLEYYLGAKDHPAPFGGRASDLDALDAWLDASAAPPYASLVAPAGRGKSALLAHWVTRLASRSETSAEIVHVVYFPISIRFNTNLETVVFASLAGRMAHVYGEKVTQAVDAQQYRGVFSDYLRRTPPNGGRVLVVLDGLDEAAGWEAAADLFPTVPPSHLRVIVAARPLALDKDETAWLNRLGWEMPNRAKRISLVGLDREGVRDVLSQMGNPLDALATKIDLISKLYELSEGDPLLVRLYVEALLPQGAQTATLTPNELAKLQPGLEAYFKRWFEEQQKLWGAAKPMQHKTVRGVLNLCAVAVGPLKKDDVLALAPDIFEDSGLLEEAVAAVSRFIIGDGLPNGYVFSHPRLGEYFAAKLTERERQAWQARFLQYGRDTLSALENRTLLPKNAPAYVVHYYGAHLTQAKVSATDFYALVCEGWLLAWEWLEGTPAGFLNDTDRAWQQAEVEGAAALGQQIRAALCFASVTSLSANISKDLLVACVKAGVISPALGLVMARQKTETKDRAECLAAVAKFHPSESHAIMIEALMTICAISDEASRAGVLVEIAPRLPESLLGETLSVARAISNEQSRANVLVEIASRLPERDQVAVFGEALSAARAIFNEQSRASVLAEIAKRLPESLLVETLSAARAIFNEQSRAKVLVEIAPRLPDRDQTVVFREALSAARAIFNEQSRADVLAEIARRLPESLFAETFVAAFTISREDCRDRVLVEMERRSPKRFKAASVDSKLLWNLDSLDSIVFDKQSHTYIWKEFVSWLPEHDQALVFDKEAWMAARAISDELPRANVLEEIALRLPERDQAFVFGEKLAAVRAISNEESRIDALMKIARRLPESLLWEALAAARAISHAWSRASILNEIAPRLPERHQAVVFGEALAAARAISNKESRASVLVKIAPWLPEHDQAVVFGEALAAARAISNEQSRVSVLVEIAPRLPQSLFGETLAVARAISNEQSRARVLMKIAPRLPQSLIGEAMVAARAISDERSRARILVEIPPSLPESLLGEALAMARAISDEWSRVRILMKIAPSLPESLLGEALAMARAISVEWARANILEEIAPRLAERDQAVVFGEALAAARAISNEESRASVLVKIAPWLPEHDQAVVFGEGLAAACAISSEGYRANVLMKIAPWLPERDQAIALMEAWIAVRAISDEKSRVRVLGELAPRLPESLLGQALQMARALCHEDEIFTVLSRIASRWSAACRSTQKSEFDELSATLRSFARTKRLQLLQAIQALLPVVAEQGGVPALRETARAIVDTAKWWP